MKEINIHSNPEYDLPNEKICKSIIRYIFNIKEVCIYEISVIFTSDIFVSDLKKKVFFKRRMDRCYCFPTTY